MNNNEARVRSRLLTTPKLHRRVSQNLPAKPVLPKGEHRCPPIATKEISNSLSENYRENQQLNLSPRRPSVGQSRLSPDGNYSPLSPASGVSAACTAMANACSHDHDYISVEPPRIRRQSALAPCQISPAATVLQPRCANSERTIAPSCVVQKEDGSHYCPDIKPNRGAPHPPPPVKLMQPTTPCQAKPAREPRSTLRRRYFRHNGTVNTDASQIIGDLPRNTHMFVSTSKTAEPRAPSRRLKQRPDDIKPKEVMLTKSDIVPLSPKPVKQDDVTMDEINDDGSFDLSTDKLTAAWHSLVNSVKKDTGPNETDLDPGSEPQYQSTPQASYNEVETSPLSCASPLLPKVALCVCGESRVACSNCEKTQTDSNGATDSAYSSLASSLCSPPPTSTGTPTFSNEFRPNSSSRPASGSRPPSGGKRVAPCSISTSSSSSSCATSSDDDSELSAMSPRSDISPRTVENVNQVTDGRLATDSSPVNKSNPRSSRKGHKVVTTKNGKKYLRQKDSSKKLLTGHLVQPTPPKKPPSKKDAVPMRLRALPTSFWQEPNRVNPSPYSVLPPVQPLFRQGYADDVADIRPVTPPQEIKDTEPHENRGDAANTSMVINGDDPELLFRLFDTVEPQNRPTGNKIKRGRPKKTPREMPPPRLILDNNPCIIQSITEKLFPKLTINRSCVSMHAVEKPVTGDDEYSCSLISEVEDYSTIGLYAFGGKSNLLEEDADTAEDNTNVTSSTPMISRMTSLSLPQLSINQDYSQLLTEVAAVL